MSEPYGRLMQRRDAQIIELRKAGLSCRETAERVGIPEYQVYRCMTRNGLAGQLRARHYRVNPAQLRPESALKRALDEYDVLTIERGANGEYIVTLNDVFTGEECATLPGAIGSALRRAGG